MHNNNKDSYVILQKFLFLTQVILLSIRIYFSSNHWKHNY